MRRVETVCSVAVLPLLWSVSIPVHSQGAGEDLTPCGAARPEPAQSGIWGVAFCNRTGHDVVVQFRDNDCPADNWSRRGDVYEKQLARGQSVTVPLCYARESHPAASPPAGVPMLRVPGGKGVVTTWSIVGDCGDRSDRHSVDARTFYDRGSYETGIVLLQHPAGAAHCFGAPESAAATAAPAATAEPAASSAGASTAGKSAAPSAAPPMPAAALAAPPAAALAATTAASASSGAALTGGPPSLSAAIDSNSRFTHAVNVFATSAQNAPNYRCRFRLALDFSDGSSWVDSVQVEVHTATANAPVVTRKYGKTVTRVQLNSQECAPL